MSYLHARQELRREAADHFQTRQVVLTPSGEIKPFGDPLSFLEMQTLRKQGSIQQVSEGQLFANLGVSLQLVVEHKGRKALVLVQQGSTLKLVSGYVPEENLHQPLQTAWAELMEEVLPIAQDGLIYGFVREGKLLPDPYCLERESTLAICPSAFLPWVTLRSFQSESWPAGYYVHEPTASLQLVYPITVELPDMINLRHAEDIFEHSTSGQGELVSRYDPNCFCVLMELDSQSSPTGHFYQLVEGEWEQKDVSALTLSEFFTRT
ncbi:hypothetical protein [Parendozoicomonas haliclonae]|uniref:Uncharacterized protein n=1 Tax=Parendozoicomonas haliclonae TaxID=1960125 RepID=A0A1X7AG99_9GAMM|nr:hypothetical protein [Parendozoicomonas haliclonae]SMA37721.1 hypothetical protein EHSB41UT_00778 [Parendozoicomonas haliclonae]